MDDHHENQGRLTVESEAPENTVEDRDQDAEERAANEWQDKYTRLAADFENYKKRNAAERLQLRNQIEREIYGQIISFYDDIERLSQHAQDSEFGEGVDAIRSRWQAWLEERNIRVMQPEGEKFDHNLHEAVMELPVEDTELDGKVVNVVEPGYWHEDRVLRHAKVAVGRYQGYGDGEIEIKEEDDT